MSIRQRFGDWLIRQVKGVSGLDVLMGAEAKAWHPDTSFNRLSAEGYEYNPVVYACINVLMDAMEEAPVLVEVRNRKGEWEEKPDHALAKLLHHPNPDMGEDEFQSVTTLFQKLAGNAYWEKERSKAGRVVGLWPMRPDRVTILAVDAIPGQRVKHRVQGYKWQWGAESVTLPAKDVIHFKEHHPRNDLYGMAPLKAGAREGDTDNRATNYVASFFDNAAVPKGLMKVKHRVDVAEQKRLGKLIHDMFTGRGGWHETLILGEGSEWVELAETFKDMDFPNLRKITETRICQIFKVPPIIANTYAGLEQASYSNYEQAAIEFTRRTVIPMYRRFDTVLNRSLAWEFGPDVRVRSDTSQLASLAEDMNELWERATAAVQAGWAMVNDARIEAGLEPVEGGWVFIRSPMMMEIEGQLEGQKAYRITSPERKALPAPNDDRLDRYYKAFDLVARAWEAIFEKQARKLFQEERDEILAILRKEGKQSITGDPFTAFLDAVIAFLISRKMTWQDAFYPLFAGLTSAQAEEILGALGIAWDITSPEVQQFLQEYTIKFADEIEEATERAVRELVAQAQEEGWSVPRLREELMAQYEEFDQNRADMIARTETIRSSNAGTHEGWRLAGIERTQWYASIDGRQCPFCEYMHQKYGPGTEGISVTENYVNLGDEISVQQADGTRKSMTVKYADVPYPPLHTRCRCTILAVSQ